MSTTRGSARYAGLLPVEPSEEFVRPTTLENDLLPSLRRRPLRALARFLTALCIGMAATLAWQSYGDAARQMIANSYPQFGWLAPRRALAAQKASDGIALAASPDHQQLDAIMRHLHAMQQSIDRVAAGQEQVTRTVDQIATGIVAGHQQTTRATDQTSTTVGQASTAKASDIAVESRADGPSAQPTVRLDTKPTEARPPQTLPERKLLSAASGHDTSCFPSASAVLQNHPGGWPSWTLKAPGHEGTMCWYASARPRESVHRPTAIDHRREMMPREREIIGITENGVSAPPVTYTRAPE
jgi:hypothetical protein